MPLLIHGVAWWLAGLFVGSGGAVRTPAASLLVVVAGAIAAGLLWLARRRASRAGVRLTPLFAVAGMIAADAAHTERSQCAARLHAALQSGHTVWAVFDDASAPRVRDAVWRRGAVSRGEAHERARWPRCAVPVSVQWADTAPPPGHTVELRGVSLRTDRGLRLDKVTVTNAHGPRDEWRVWRGRIATVIDERFGARAPLVRALLIADQHGIPVELRESYADAGLVHLLSVSGMHVAIIAGALLTLGGAARVSKVRMEPLALALVVLYVLLLGSPAPAVRSAVMLAVTAISARMQRPVHEWTALALGAVVPTVDPLVVRDLGWQLSVSGMAALVAARGLKRDWRTVAHYREHHGVVPRSRIRRFSHWLATQRGVAGWLVSELATGIVATVVTAPVIAWTFGRISAVAPLANLVAGPIVAVLQPALFAALLWALLAPPLVAGWLPDATQPLMAALDRVADMAASVPGAVVPVAPTLATAVGTGIAAACLVRATADLHPRRRGRGHGGRWVTGAAMALVVTAWWPVVAPQRGPFELHVLDVGQGDAVAVRTPRGRWVLVDAGPRWRGGDAGRRTVVPYVRRRGGDVMLFVMSHAHDDHVGGAASVVRALRVPRWWEPAFVTGSPGYRAALEAVRDTRAAWERVEPGRSWEADGVTFTVLAPHATWTAQQTEANETSVVLRVSYGRHRVLLTGDAEHDEEAWLLQAYGADALRAHVLKLGHHGSRTSSGPALLDVVRPQVGIASVGAGNRYGHPSPETLAEFLRRGTPVLRTDRSGTIVVRSDGRTLEVETDGERWIVPDSLRIQ